MEHKSLDSVQRNEVFFFFFCNINRNEVTTTVELKQPHLCIAQKLINLNKYNTQFMLIYSPFLENFDLAPICIAELYPSRTSVGIDLRLFVL